MLKKVISPILFLPLALFINSPNVLPNETKVLIDNGSEEKPKIPLIGYSEIEKKAFKYIVELKAKGNVDFNSSQFKMKGSGESLNFEVKIEKVKNGGKYDLFDIGQLEDILFLGYEYYDKC